MLNKEKVEESINLSRKYGSMGVEHVK